MDWFLLALIPPFLFALSNRIDKYLLEDYFEGKSGALILFSGFISILILPVIYFIQPSVIFVPVFYALILIFTGFIYILYLFPYFWALKLDEASRVAPLFQSIPVFVIILGFLFLGDAISFAQLAAGGLIVAGAFGLSSNLSKSGVSFKKKIVLFMFLASFMIALSYVLLKFAAINTDFFTALFWQQIGFLILGIILFLKKDYRAQFLSVFKKNSKKILSLNIFNEIINILASFLFAYITLLAPIGLVSLVNGLQPFYILFVGAIITIFAPWLGKETISKKSILQKALFIAIMAVGTISLGLTL